MEVVMLSETELANRWGVSPKSLQRWRIEKRGPAYLKFSKSVRYSIEDVLTYERDHRNCLQGSNVTPLSQTSVSTDVKSSDKTPQSLKDASLISADEAASITKLPAYYFTSKKMRNELGISHYYVGRIVRFNLGEIQQWEISKAISAFGISIDTEMAPHPNVQESIPAQKYTLREAMHLLAIGKLKLTT